MMSIDGILEIKNGNHHINVTRVENRVIFDFSSWETWQSFRQFGGPQRKVLKLIKDKIIIRIQEKEILKINRGIPKLLSIKGFFRIIWIELTK